MIWFKVCLLFFGALMALYLYLLYQRLWQLISDYPILADQKMIWWLRLLLGVNVGLLVLCALIFWF